MNNNNMKTEKEDYTDAMMSDPAPDGNVPGDENGGQDEETANLTRKLPERVPVFPGSDNVIFPGMALPEEVQEEHHKKLLDKIVMNDKLFISTATKTESGQAESKDDLYSVGTLCVIIQMNRGSDGTMSFIIQGLYRARLEEIYKDDGFWWAKITYPKEKIEEEDKIGALVRNVREQFLSLLGSVPGAPEELKSLVEKLESPGRLADMVCAHIDVPAEEKQDVLETFDVKERIEKVGRLLAKELEFAQITNKIRRQARDEINRGQKEFFLRHQLKAIKDELGESDTHSAEIDDIKEQLQQKDLPRTVEEAAEHELGRLESINPASPEYNVVRTYLDWLIKLPWKESNEENLHLKNASTILDEDHFGLDKVKERIIEFLAVRKLRKDMKGSILCFVGPPGTGKTSIGKSIARATGREYVRVSLGGMHDEAEIKGHRRTYVGALPGQLILGINKARSKNPVFMLDEVDKLSSNFRGDPASALLEALDPEQNKNFTDQYLDLPFDLSEVLFICTANIPDTIPPALRDRMEILNFAGYTEEEKMKIAEKYLVPKQIEAHGLDDTNLSFTEGALSSIISSYTREAGVRNLERNIASVCRKVARKVAAKEIERARVKKRDIPNMLGPAQYLPEVAERVNEPGVATGLAWTQAGGMVMFVEASKMQGKGKITLTGQLGDVMKESAQAALTYIRAHADSFGVDPKMFQTNDFHIHVPAGAIPKDGPSAGITMALALISLCTDKKLKHNVGMTGEITLRGKVLPVGGIKEKAIAAKSAGLDTVILPKQNEKDLPDIPRQAKKKLDFNFVGTIDDILPLALEG